MSVTPFKRWPVYSPSCSSEGISALNLFPKLWLFSLIQTKTVAGNDMSMLDLYNVNQNEKWLLSAILVQGFCRVQGDLFNTTQNAI